MKRLIIIGAGMLGRKVCNYARDAGFDVIGFLDGRANVLDGFKGYPPILGAVEDWVVHEQDRFVCAVAEGMARRKYVSIIEKKGGTFASIVHPLAYVGPNVLLGDGCVVCPFAVVDCDLSIGRHVIVNVHSLVAHDCLLEDYVTLSPNVHLGGLTVVRANSFLGMSASTIPRVEIGASSVIAAGACVTRNIPNDVLAAGVPATVKKTLR